METDSFSVFTCLDGASKSDTELIDSDVIRDHLEEVDDWLRHMTSFTDVKAYKNGGQSSRSSVRLFLEESCRKLEELEVDLKSGGREDYGSEHTEELRRLEAQINTFNMADTVFRLFLPRNFDGPTVGKYWGAIKGAMDVSGTLHPLTSLKRC